MLRLRFWWWAAVIVACGVAAYVRADSGFAFLYWWIGLIAAARLLGSAIVRLAEAAMTWLMRRAGNESFNRHTADPLMRRIFIAASSLCFLVVALFAAYTLSAYQDRQWDDLALLGLFALQMIFYVWKPWSDEDEDNEDDF